VTYQEMSRISIYEFSKTSLLFWVILLSVLRLVSLIILQIRLLFFRDYYITELLFLIVKISNFCILLRFIQNITIIGSIFCY